MEPEGSLPHSQEPAPVSILSQISNCFQYNTTVDSLPKIAPHIKLWRSYVSHIFVRTVMTSRFCTAPQTLTATPTQLTRPSSGIHLGNLSWLRAAPSNAPTRSGLLPRTEAVPATERGVLTVNDISRILADFKERHRLLNCNSNRCFNHHHSRPLPTACYRQRSLATCNNRLLG
jgi:hypothetical protein